jgi:Do/DeqQ family serine protease
MKRNILFTALIAIVVSIITTVAIIRLGPAWKTIKIEHIDSQPVSGVLYSKDAKGVYTPVDFTTIAAKVTPTVVHIRSTMTMETASNQDVPDPFRQFFGDPFYRKFFGPENNQPQTPQAEVASGSGVVINGDGYIVTNNHVIENANDIDVTLSDNRSFKATVVGTDPLTDLAVIHIKAHDLPSLPIVNSDEVKVGEWVLAVGNPFNLNSTVTAGIVSAKARNINIMKNRSAIEAYIQTDAAINPGNSGGALVDLNGGLIGINSAIASPTGSYAGYGFAVPSNLVSKVVEDILKYGSVQRGILGVSIQSVNSDIAKDKHLDRVEGVYVDSVMVNSAAQKAGIKSGDIITEVDGTKVNSSPELQEYIARHKPGDEVTLKLDRKGEEKTVSAVLKNNEGNTKTEVRPRNEVENQLGADFAPLSPESAKKMNIEGGVKVTKLYPGLLRQQTNIQEGFIITSIDGKPVKTVDDVTKALKDKKGGVLIEGFYENAPDNKLYYGFGM